MWQQFLNHIGTGQIKYLVKLIFFFYIFVIPKLYLSFSFQLPSHAPSPPISQGNRVFFLTVYLKNWEYSQSLLSEETLPNNSCESPLLPPSFSSSPFLFLIFAFSCFGVWWLFDTKQGAVLRLQSTGNTVSGELCSDVRRYRGFLLLR